MACHIPSGPGAIQVVNVLPGQRGNMKLPLETVGRWFMDANSGKTFRISESKTVQIRFDALNIFNHAEIPDAEMIEANQTPLDCCSGGCRAREDSPRVTRPCRRRFVSVSEITRSTPLTLPSTSREPKMDTL